MFSRLPDAVRVAGNCLFADACALLRPATVILSLLTTPVLWAATPLGTVINNTASVEYLVGGSTTLHALSNTASFSVEGFGITDTAELVIQQFPEDPTPYPGNQLTYQVTLVNTGDNTLRDGQLNIYAPADSTVNFANTTVTGEAVTGAQATKNHLLYRIPIADLVFFGRSVTTFSITLPLSLKTGANSIDIDYLANNTLITNGSYMLNIVDRTRSKVELLALDPDHKATPRLVAPTQFKNDSGAFVDIAPPSVNGTTTPVTASPVSLIPTKELSHHQTLFLNINDPDHNQDHRAVDSVEIDLSLADNGEHELIRLRETGTDTGEFTGYIRLASSSASANDGTLQVAENSHLSVAYTDSLDSSDSVSVNVLVDPYGRLFDSETGAMLDGYTVTLMNADTGQPAAVYGDDGVSAYPASMVSGGSVIDAGGKAYNYPPGNYRFPLIAPGNYQLIVTPPSGADYRWPSQKTDTQMSGLPTAPYALDLGSRRETFIVKAGPPVKLDIPIDPLHAQLFVRRSQSKEVVSAGEFVQFKVQVENTALINIDNVVLTDILPQGFRLRPGSTTINGITAADPGVSRNGLNLTFNLGTIPTVQTFTIAYVVELGAINPGETYSTSHATGNGGAIISNQSRISTRINEDLIRTRNILIGRVLAHDENGQPTNQGLGGIRIYLENGAYAVTDETGHYHFEGVTPGTHVVQLDLDTLPPQYEVIPFEQNTRFAGRAWSKFVELQGGTLWKVDFHAALRAKPTGNLDIHLDSDASDSAHVLNYHVKLTNRAIALKNLKLTLMLPEGASYTSGSSRLGNRTIDDPVITENILSYSLPTLDADLQQDLTLSATLANNLIDELIAKAMVSFDTPDKKNQRSNILEHKLRRQITETGRETQNHTLRPYFDTLSSTLNEADRHVLDRLAAQLEGLESIHIEAIGHSDNKPIRPRNRDRFADNRILSEQRALSVANYLRDKLQLTPAQVVVEGRGDVAPLADNATADGRALNRRVELHISADRVTRTARLDRSQAEATQQNIPTIGLRPGESGITTPELTTVQAAQPMRYDESWLANTQPGLDWVSPAVGELPAIPSVTLAIKHDLRQKIDVMLNGEPVPPVKFDGTAKNVAGVALSRWTGVDLRDGDNKFEVIVRDKDDNELQYLSRTVHYATPPVDAVFVKERSILTADGITRPVIALRLTDKDGYAARRDTGGSYDIAAPYRPLRSGKFDNAVLPGSAPVKPAYTVGPDGIALITLEPTTQAGEATLTLPLMSGVKLIKAELSAPGRDWIIVGFAEGTAGYNTLQGNTELLKGDAASEHLYSNGRVAFFAKGKLDSKWLLTMAYDSDKETLARNPSLFQTIRPGTFYTVYGDASRQGFEGPSRNKLYLKLERDQFYALFGDYNTDLNNTRLSAYNRALTGIKSRYHDERHDIILFESESNQAFSRDEIRGKGITGPYALSRKNIVLNSEKVNIEVRDRFHSENIIKKRSLQRYTDYDIDYQRGTISFREPVMFTDAELNHVFITASFESFDTQDISRTIGGRVESKFGSATLGVTHINDGQRGGEGQLTGGDLKIQLGTSTLIRAETANSSTSSNAGTTEGSAWLTSVEHRANNWNSKFYTQQTASGFGLGQTNSAEAGTRKTGFEASIRATPRLNLKTEAYQQDNLVTLAKRQVVEAQSHLQIDQDTLRLGLRSARDEIGNQILGSDQLSAGVNHRTLNNKMTLKLDRDQAFGSTNNIDFPTATRLGADYLVTDTTTLFAQQQWTDSKQRNTTSSQLGIKTRPWDGSEAAATVKQQQNNGHGDTASNLSLRQKWRINTAWSLDFGAEQSRAMTRATPFNTNIPYAHGSSSDFKAQSIGLSYNPGAWTWQNRLEHRDSASDESWSLAISIATSPTSALSTISALQRRDSRSTNQHKIDTALRLDLAWREANSPWLTLDRLELKQEDHRDSTFGYNNWRVINHLNTNYKIERWQLAIQYGIKYVAENVDKSTYRGITDLFGIETRYDLTPSWDIGAQLSDLHSWRNKQQDYSAGVSIGHSFMTNIWLSAGYNWVGFTDHDFSAARNTSQGAYLRFRIKFDQVSLNEAVKWAGQ